MTHEILINVTPQETRVAMLEQGVVQELHIERSSARGSSATSISAASRACCPACKARSSRSASSARRSCTSPTSGSIARTGTAASDRPIEKILHEGQSLLVQVIKDPIGTKGARLSTQVSLAGRLLVYLPQDSHIGISQRIEDEAERENAARAGCSTLLPEGTAGGFIIRTMAETAIRARDAEPTSST